MTNDNNQTPKPYFRIWEIVLWILIPVIIAALLVDTSPTIGLALGVFVSGIALLGFLGKLRQFRIKFTRSTGLAFVAAVLLGISGDELVTRNELNRLKAISSEAYLNHLEKVRSDEIWLGELERLLPDEYARELIHREEQIALLQLEKTQAQNARSEERSHRSKDRQQAREQENAATFRTEQQTYISALHLNITDLENAAEFTYNTRGDLLYALDYFDGYGEFVARGEKYVLSVQETNLRNRMKALLSASQVREFPKMRDRYGPIQRSANWRNAYTRDVKLRTIGQAFRTAEFSGSWYYLKANRLEDYEAIGPELMRMRFSRAEFKVSQNGEGTVWKLALAPNDAAVGEWVSELMFLEAKE